MTTVLLDATALGGASGQRGIGTYLRNVLRALPSIDGLDVHALTTDPSTLPLGVHPVGVSRIAPGRWSLLEHDVRLPRDFRRRPADVRHAAGLGPPRAAAPPVVVTLFDVIPLVVHDPALEAVRRRWQRLAPRYREAAAIVAISHHTAARGIEVLGLDPARVHVAHLAAEARFAPAAGPRDAALLVVGEFEHRKGFPAACAVVAAVAARGHPHRLRLAGRVAPWVVDEVRAVIGSSARPDRVDVLGFVDDIAAEYQSTSVFLGVSRAEGFGLPALEAMACATPVVAFDNTATTEVVGDGGILVRDGDVAAMTDAVCALLDDPQAWQAASARAVQRAASFSWDRCAAVHAEVYRSVAR